MIILSSPLFKHKLLNHFNFNINCFNTVFIGPRPLPLYLVPLVVQDVLVYNSSLQNIAYPECIAVIWASLSLSQPQGFYFVWYLFIFTWYRESILINNPASWWILLLAN